MTPPTLTTLQHPDYETMHAAAAQRRAAVINTLSNVGAREVRVVLQTVRRQISQHAGGRGDVAQTVTDLAHGDDETWAVSEHHYHGRRALECTCAMFDAGRPCLHIVAVTQLEAACRDQASAGPVWSN